VLLENVLRHAGNGVVTERHVTSVSGWRPEPDKSLEVPFMPGRVVLQDFTGVPAVVDLAAMRDAIAALGGDPDRINPLVPTDLVIDHSVQVDFFGAATAFRLNVEREMERNGERYQLLRWAQQAFRRFRVVPPGTGIVHQVNLEYLASVVRSSDDATPVLFPDTLVGTDSHTTMINGLGVVGWGVGGIEAEAVMLGQPYFMQLPEVVGMKLTGTLPREATATDLVLTATQMLRGFGVVGRFVEFFGPGLHTLGLADRATIANMSPEYGATIGFFPVDRETLAYLRRTGRPDDLVNRVEHYCRAQRLFHLPETPDPEYSAVLELDLGSVEPSVAGPRRPQDRIALSAVKESFRTSLPNLVPADADRDPDSAATATVVGTEIELDGQRVPMQDGSVVIAAITSCTNTSNPSVMLGAGLVARKAVARGLNRRPWVRPGACSSPWRPSTSIWSVMAARPASATAVPSRSPSLTPSRSMAWCVPRSSRGTGTSKPACTRLSARAIWHPPCSWWRTPSPGGSTSTWTPSRSAQAATANPCISATSGRAPTKLMLRSRQR
jgi:aconitate hydratase